MAEIPSWWGQAEIDQAYKVAEDNANKFLASGNTQAANTNHQIMQQLVGARDAMVAGSSGGGGGGGGSDTSAMDLQLQQQQKYERDTRQRQAMQAVKAAFAQYGLTSLYGKIEEYASMDYSADTIAIMLRDTPEYKERFPAMAALSAKGRAISESAYIEYERAMSQYESLFGLPEGMLSSRENTAKFLTNELSAREVEERATQASASIYTLPKEYRDMMQQYYGVDSGGLTAYFLDPEMAQPLLERQYVSAQLGMEAAQRSIGVDKTLAETLYERGVNREQAAQGFQQVAGMSNLALGRGDVATQGQQIGATFNLDAESKKAVERASKAKAGAFQQGGSYVSGQGGVSGLASSST